jgi:gliding motility-associated-like protein
MKGRISQLLVLLLIVSFRTSGADYYWVGGSGNWSDYANHWATTSGGTTFHTQVPISTDNVFFNDQSFTGNAQTVTIDVPAVCGNFDWSNSGQTFSGAVNGPTIAGTQNIEIFGNYILDNRMRPSPYEGIFRFLSTTNADIDPKGVKFIDYTYDEKFRFESNGNWTLLSTIDIIGGLKHENGTINFGNTTQNLGYLFSTGSNNKTLNLQSSIINLVGPGRYAYQTDVWTIENSTNLTLNAGTSTLNVNFTNLNEPYLTTNQNRARFNGGGKTYHNLTSSATTYLILNNDNNTFNNVSLFGKADFLSSNSFNGVLLLSKGYEYRFRGTNTQTFNAGSSINAIGDCQSYIYILSTDLDSTRKARFTAASWASSTLNYTIIFNTQFSVGINANNSVDNGQNTGITFVSPAGTDTYWIGGDGDWNDPTQWSIGCVPTPLDNVFFDASSFTAPGQKVTISTKNAYCKNMSWVGATNNPELAHSGILDVSLNIHGSLTFIPNMSNSMRKQTNFWGSGAGNTITSAGQTFKFPVNFNGTGTYTLQDAFEVRGIDGDIETGIITHNSGTLITNNQNVSAKRFQSLNTGRIRSMNMGSSTFTLYNDNNEFSDANKVWVVQDPNMTLNSGTSTININNRIPNVPSFFRGGNGFSYYNVNFLNPENLTEIEEFPNVIFRNLTFAGNAKVKENIIVNNLLRFAPGKTYTIEDDNKITLGNSATLDANGNCSNYIYIQSNNNSQTTIEKLGGADVVVTYTYIKNVASGTVAFNATNSFDLGGNSGWTIAGAASRNLYWVGGTGNWSNSANWSHSSGGAGGECPPTVTDNVFFDANSFNAAGQSVTIDVNPATAKDINWTGVLNNPSLNGIDDHALDVYGSLTLSTNMNINNFLGQLNFKGSGNNFITTNGKIFRTRRVKFDSGTGSYTMLDNFSTTADDFRGSVQLVSGTLNTNGRTMNWNGFDSFDGSFEPSGVTKPYTLTRTLNLGSSIINILGRTITEDWDVSENDGTSVGLTINAGTSTINLPTTDNNKIRLGTNTYYNINTLSNTNGAELKLYGNATFNSLKLNSNTRIFNNTTVNDTMYFKPGVVATYQEGSTHNFGVNSKIILQGTSTERISIQSSNTSTNVNWIKPTGNICATKVNIRNNTGSGGAIFQIGLDPDNQSTANVGWNLQPFDTPGSVSLSGSNNICSGNNTTLTFTLTPALPKNIVYTDGTNNFTLNAINTNVHTVVVNPTVTTTYSIVSASTNVCVSGPVAINGTAVITILPNTAIATQPNPLTICEGQNANFSVGATGHNLTYQWRENASDISNGGIYSGTSTNNLTLTAAISSANYSVVVNGSCGSATSNNVALTVKPLPSVSGLLNKSICSGENSNLLLSSSPVGASFSWTSGAVAGLSGNGLGSGGTISQVLVQNGSTTLDAVYTVSPTLNGCVGNPSDVTVRVKPLPSLNNSLTHSICSGATTNITLSSTVSGTTYSWASPAVGNITGNSDGSGGTISQTLSNSINNSVGVVYSITPTADLCVGTIRDLVVNVFPLPSVDSRADEDICSGATTNIILGSNVSGSSYTWTSANVSDLSGNLAGSGSSINQSLVNSSIASLTATYQVTATANGCSGSARAININVLPNPQVNALADQNLCSGSATNLNLSSPVSGASFSWTSPSVANISGNSNGSGNSIVQTLSNSSNGSITLGYLVTATANGCSGVPRTINVNVHPIPSLNLATESICSGNTSNLSLGSNVSGATFTWTTSPTTDVTGNSDGSGSVISQALTSSAVVSRTVVYSVIVRANNCNSLPSNASIEVLPRPNVLSNNTANLCSGASTSLSLSSDISGATFSWTSSAVAGVTGNSNGSGNAITQLLTNSTSNIVNVVYQVTASSSGCPSSPPLDITVSVAPLPSVNATTNHTICSQATTNILLGSNVAGSTYSWTTAPQVNLQGNIDGTGNVIAQTLENQSKSILSALYQVRATANNCVGNPLNINVQVQPVVVYTGPTEDSICSGSSTNISLSSDVVGSTYSWSSAAVASLTGNSNGTGNIISQSISNSSSNMLQAVYVVTPQIGLCSGTSANIAVKVYPVTLAGNVSGGNTICEGSTSNLLTLAGNTGRVIRWESSTSPFSTWSPIAHTNNTYTSIALNTTTRFRAIVSSGVCPVGTSGSTEVVVIPGAVNTGTITPGNTICENQNGNTLSIVGYTGSMVRWERSETPFTSWTAIANNTDTYNPGVLTQTTMYRAVITNGVCTEANTSSSTITVLQRPRISVQPSPPPALCEGTGTDLFEITATGSTLNYQWRENNANLSDGGIYSGTNTDRLTISNPPLSLNGNTYQVFISNTCGSALSDPVAVVINENTSISAQPLSPTSTCLGNGAQFTVNAQGTNLTFQWRESGVNLTNTAIYSGVSTNTLQMSSTTQDMDNRFYDVVVSGVCGSETSIQARLQVIPLTSLSQTPSNISLCEGLSAEFKAEAQGANLIYQWKEDNNNLIEGGIYGGVNTNTLSISSLSPNMDNRQYQLEVIGTCGSVSAQAQLRVNRAVSITSSPSTVNVCEGFPASFTVQAQGTGLSYEWSENNTPINDGGIYSGSSQNTLNISNSSLSLDSNQYSVKVKGLCSEANSSIAYLIVNDNTIISSQPINDTICAGGVAAFTVTSTGSNVSYRWLEDGQALVEGQTYLGTNSNKLQINSPTANFSGRTYRVEVQGQCGSIQSQSARLQVENLLSIVSQPSNVSICEGADANFSVQAQGSGLSYQWEENSTDLIDNVVYTGSQSNTLQLSKPSATLNGRTYSLSIKASCGSVNSSIALLTINSPIVLSQQPKDSTVCAGSGVSFTGLGTGTGLSYQWIKNGTLQASETSNQIVLPSTNVLMNNDVYRLRMTGTCNSVESNEVRLRVNAGTVLLSDLSNRTLCAGESTNFLVNAEGSNLSYEWREDGQVLSGVTGNSYNLANVAAQPRTRNYQVKVTGLCGIVNSKEAVLTVQTPTAIVSQPRDTSVCQGNTVAVTFKVEGEGLTYQWREDGVYLIGATSPQLTLSNINSSSNGKRYDVEVSGQCGDVQSAQALLTVFSSSLGGNITGGQTVCENTTSLDLVLNGQVGTIARWESQEQGNTNWQTIVNTSNIQSTGMLSNSTRYRAIVKSGVCPEAISSIALVGVDKQVDDPDAGPDRAVCDTVLTLQATEPLLGIGTWQTVAGGRFVDVSKANTVFSGQTGTSYQLIWSVRNGVCPSKSDVLEIQLRSVVRAETSSDTTIKLGETASLWAIGGSNYEWSPVESLNIPTIFNPLASPKVSTLYMVKVSDNFGCTVTDSVLVIVDDNISIKIPNAFSPNDDRENDTWVIENVKYYPEATMEIFNRWGQVVRKMEGGRNINWDGKNNNGADLEVGTYFYVFKEKPSDNGKAGSVTIVR